MKPRINTELDLLNYMMEIAKECDIEFNYSNNVYDRIVKLSVWGGEPHSRALFTHKVVEVQPHNVTFEIEVHN